MRQPIFAIIIFTGSVLISCQTGNTRYLGQEPPGKTPLKFAPGVVSKDDQYEFGSVFSKDGQQFYFGVNVGQRAEIRFMEFRDHGWTSAERLIPGAEWNHNDPFLSPDGRLYFISDRPSVDGGTDKDYDIWYLEREGTAWSKAINAGDEINSDKNEYYISFTEEGSMFFSSNKANGGSNFDIYTSSAVGGKFQTPTRLGEGVNSRHYEADVFVAPDGAYLIFCADRPDGNGSGDLYISFKSEDGTWQAAKNLGKKINTPGHELCPFVTHDGKYFFYTSNQDIYWVDASVLEELR